MSIYDSLDVGPANYTPLTPLRFLQRAEQYHGDKIGLAHGDLSWTWREVATRCRRLASALLAHGIERGDTVSIIAPNSPAMFEAQFGIPMAGAVINNLNIRIEPETLAFVLDHCESKVLLVDSEFSALVKAAVERLGRSLLVIDVLDSMGPENERIGTMDYEAFLQGGDPDFVSNEPKSELQPIALNYTSGTTGNPKGVVYDHRNAFVESLGNLISWGVTGQPVQLWVAPIFHANGWCYLWPMTGLGATNVMVRKPSGKVILDLITKHRVTHICGAPIITQMMAQVPGADQLRFDHPIKMLTSGAPPTSENFMNMEKMGIELYHGYGLTEVWGPAIFREPSPEWAELEPIDRAKLKLRQGIPNLVVDDMMVAHPGTCDAVPRDGVTMGEVLFRGNMVMRGYLRNPEATQEAFEGGYFHSGDLAVWHPDGSIELKDRAKDIIISGGENISSLEVEGVIADIPGVLGVAVIAVPDARWGESPWAVVEAAENANLTADFVLAECRKHLVGFKIPKGVTFCPIARTPTGKVQKYLLRQKVAADTQ